MPFSLRQSLLGKTTVQITMKNPISYPQCRYLNPFNSSESVVHM